MNKKKAILFLIEDEDYFNNNRLIKLKKLLIKKNLRIVKQMQMPIIVCYQNKEDGTQFMRWLGAGPLYYFAEGEDKGKKLENAFYYAYAKGYMDVLAVGSKLVDLSLDDLTEAFELLE